MATQLPNLTISRRTYTPATNAETMANYILEWFDDEAFSSSSLVPDLHENFVSLVFKLDETKRTYVITFSGDKDEFAVIEGPILSKDMVKSGVLVNGVDYWSNGREWFHSMEPQLVFDK